MSHERRRAQHHAQHGARRTALKLLLFGVLLLIGVAWISADDGERAVMVRALLRNVARHLF